VDQWAKHFSALPMGASARDQSTSMDELGRKVYRSPTGQQYSFPMEGEGGQRGSVVRAAAEDPKGALSSILSALVGGVGSAISAPGRAAMGQSVTNGDVWSTGGMAQLAAMPMQAPEGALRMAALRTRAYHGSDADFDVFDPTKFGTTTDPGHLGRGAYLSTDNRVGYGKANVLEFDVGLENPLELAAPSIKSDKRLLVREALGLSGDATSDEVTAALKNAGYDGVVLDNSPWGYNQKEIMAIDPKSAQRFRPTPKGD